jgi:hypothetical protein
MSPKRSGAEDFSSARSCLPARFSAIFALFLGKQGHSEFLSIERYFSFVENKPECPRFRFFHSGCFSLQIHLYLDDLGLREQIMTVRGTAGAR